MVDRGFEPETVEDTPAISFLIRALGLKRFSKNLPMERLRSINRLLYHDLLQHLYLKRGIQEVQ